MCNPPPPPPPQWLVAYSAPSHYLNKFWFVVNWTLRNKLRWNFNQYAKFVFTKCTWIYRPRNVGLAKLIDTVCSDIPFVTTAWNKNAAHILIMMLKYMNSFHINGPMYRESTAHRWQWHLMPSLLLSRSTHQFGRPWLPSDATYCSCFLGRLRRILIWGT